MEDGNGVASPDACNQFRTARAITISARSQLCAHPSDLSLCVLIPTGASVRPPHILPRCFSRDYPPPNFASTTLLTLSCEFPRPTLPPSRSYLTVEIAPILSLEVCSWSIAVAGNGGLPSRGSFQEGSCCSRLIVPVASNCRRRVESRVSNCCLPLETFPK